MNVGAGIIDLGLAIDRSGVARGALSLEARIARALSAYGEAYASYSFYEKSWDAGAQAGLRLRW